MGSNPDQVTELLASAGNGNPDAWEKLAPLIYEELRKIAQSAMKRERADHTLQPTALVNEAYVRLAGANASNWNNRSHFFGAAAKTMRRVLIEYARFSRAAKRGHGGKPQPLDDLLVSFEERAMDIVALDAALERLASMDPQQSRIVELRFFGGLTVEETARELNVSASTVERGWRVARAWLLGQVEGYATS